MCCKIHHSFEGWKGEEEEQEEEEEEEKKL